MCCTSTEVGYFSTHASLTSVMPAGEGVREASLAILGVVGEEVVEVVGRKRRDGKRRGGGT